MTALPTRVLGSDVLHVPDHCGQPMKYGQSTTWDGEFQVTTVDARCEVCPTTLDLTFRWHVGPPTGVPPLGSPLPPLDNDAYPPYAQPPSTDAATGGAARLVVTEDEAVAVLVAHQRTERGCLCGWAVLGASHAQHVVDALRAAAPTRLPERHTDPTEEP